MLYPQLESLYTINLHRSQNSFSKTALPIDGWLPHILCFYFYGFGVYYVNFVGNINIDDKLIDNLKCASNIYCFFGDVEILSWISHITHESLHHYLLKSGCLASLILETNLRKFRYLIFFRFYYLLVFAYILSNTAERQSTTSNKRRHQQQQRQAE